MGSAGAVTAAQIGRARVRHRPPGRAAARRPWVIMLSGSPWAVQAHRQQALAREIARDAADGRRVLFVDPPSNLARWHHSIERVNETLWHVEVPTFFPFGRQIPPVNLLNRLLAAALITRWLARHPGDRVLWVDEDLAAPLIGRLGESAVVYDATDLDWTFTRPWNRWNLRRYLRSAVSRADLVLVSSRALPAALPATRRPAVLLANACDPDHFRSEGPVAGWLDDLPRPRLGYLGAIDSRAFDAGLLAAVARLHPEWTFVLVGPSTRAGRAPLAGFPNVHIFPAVPYAAAPSVVRGFDVGLIPYRVGGLIDYVHPKKCFEYLSAGKPVVSTALPALSAVNAPIFLASGAGAFAEAITVALDVAREPSATAERRAAAARNSWSLAGECVRKLLTEMTG